MAPRNLQAHKKMLKHGGQWARDLGLALKRQPLAWARVGT